MAYSARRENEIQKLIARRDKYENALDNAAERDAIRVSVADRSTERHTLRSLHEGIARCTDKINRLRRLQQGRSPYVIGRARMY